MNLNEINANVNRLLQNIWAVITFLKEFCVDNAKDVSITYINADGSESVKTFPNIAKMNEEFKSYLTNNIIPSLRIGNGGVGTRRLNVYSYAELGIKRTGGTYIVTDIHKEENRTFCFHIQGQMLHASLALNCMIVGYMYSENGLVHVNSTQSQVTAYINKDGFVTLKINCEPYWGSFTIDNIRVGNGGFCTVTKVLVSETDI